MNYVKENVCNDIFALYYKIKYTFHQIASLHCNNERLRCKRNSRTRVTLIRDHFTEV